jgi:hypothetical protein
MQMVVFNVNIYIIIIYMMIILLGYTYNRKCDILALAFDGYDNSYHIIKLHY